MRICANLFIITVVVVLTVCVALPSSGELVTDAQSSARARFTLPKLFDFEHFKQLYRKSYGSLVEELTRQKLYLGRAFRVFVSSVAYKNRWSSSYLSINHLSDSTLEEAERRHLNADALSQWLTEVKTTADDEIPNYDNEEETEKPSPPAPVPMADREDIVKKFAEIVDQPDKEPGFREIAHELMSNSSELRRSEPADLNHRQLSPDQLIEEPPRLDSVSTAQSSEGVQSNNPHYVEPDLSSKQQTPTNSKWHTKVSSYLSGYTTSHIPGAQYVNLAVQLLVDTVIPYKFKDEPGAANLPDEVFVNHSRSECAQAPRDQGDCGSCYAFAAISLYERAYCEATGRRVQFSEQYLVDCGSRVIGLSGCDSGVYMRVSSFVSRFGLELRKHYPYKAREDTCPYSPETPESSMGYLRVESDGFEYLSLKHISQELHRSPLIVLVGLNDDFGSYGGGVDLPLNCNRKDLHAMVIEGSGREDGQEYWLMRNSYGLDWGERGYYKMSKHAHTCISPKFAARLRNFRVPEHSMTKRVSNEVRKRFQDSRKGAKI